MRNLQAIRLRRGHTDRSCRLHRFDKHAALHRLRNWQTFDRKHCWRYVLIASGDVRYDAMPKTRTPEQQRRPDNPWVQAAMAIVGRLSRRRLAGHELGTRDAKRIRSTVPV